jgi:hypothetical protein
MSNELIVIEKGNALSVLTSSDEIKKTIDYVREQIMKMDGGSIETASGRKKIRSNAFKATKAKTGIKSDHVDPLISQIQKKIQPEIDLIQAIKDNFNILSDGLDNVRKEVNAEVDHYEWELQRIEDEKRAAEEAEKLRLQVESDHEIALLLNEKFDREVAEKLAQEVAEEKARQEAALKAQQEREDQIRKEAEEKAKREAEEAAKLAEKEKQDAIERARKAELDRIASEERAKLAAEQAEKERIAAEALALKRAQEAAEKARADEMARQEAEKQKEIEAQKKREADNAHISKIRTEAKESLMLLGLTEEMAKSVVLAINDKQIKNVSINY